MARSLKIEIADAMYQVMFCGDESLIGIVRKINELLES